MAREMHSCPSVQGAAKWQCMAVAGTPGWSLRLERAESSRLAWAFIISIACHLLLGGGYYTGKKAVAWIEVHHPSWLQTAKSLIPEILKKKEPPPTNPLAEPPLMFVDVNPAVATTEPPPNPKFESDKNSVAANPEADKDTGIPKITGTQTDVPKASDVPKQEVVKNLQPSLPLPTAPEPTPETKPKPTVAPGDLTMGKPDLNPKSDPGEEKKARPRTIQEALARQPDKLVPGVKMKQDGGVKRRLPEAAFDVKATLFGAYESTIVAAISQRWWDLLDEHNYASDNRGKVVVNFSLHYDGTITAVKVGENTTGAEVLGYVCVKAVQDPAPFAPWPSDMRHEIASGVFDVRFTFFY